METERPLRKLLTSGNEGSARGSLSCTAGQAALTGAVFQTFVSQCADYMAQAGTSNVAGADGIDASASAGASRLDLA